MAYVQSCEVARLQSCGVAQVPGGAVLAWVRTLNTDIVDIVGVYRFIIDM